MPRYIPSIGMEVHAELATRSKMFCRCPVAFGGQPNTRVCPICLGLPGTLPVPNRAAIEMVLRTALALNCKIAMHSIFHRKNYFYPDLPKGYQVSQYGETNPLGYAGYIEIPAQDGGIKRIGIRRDHHEEDTGKLMHLPSGESGIDYNRAGVPLMEIVSEFPPDIENAEEARDYLVQLRQILLYLGVCDGKMEEGSLRCEPNISVRLEGTDRLGTKTELKNLNSFKSVQLGVAFETSRQASVLEKGEKVLQETRGWNEQREESYLMRVKEAENDYRYFPDPDLVPMVFEEAYIEELRKSLPELPLAKSLRYERDYGLDRKESWEFVIDPEWAGFYEEAVLAGGDPRLVRNEMVSEFAKHLNETGIPARESRVTPAHIVELTKMKQSGQITSKMGKDDFSAMAKDGRMPKQIVEESGAVQISDENVLGSIITEVLRSHPDVVEKYKGGQLNVKGFLVGQIMRQSKGQANPEMVQDMLQQALERA
jgi:aspartyl-tRNA(Asn)/glutamyl-tRNA(Gln) amidotransferase subunit B